MRIARLSLVFVSAAVFGFALASCGGDSGSGGPGGGSATSGLFCPTSNASSCKQADVDAYGSCVQGRCGTQMKACFGDNFQSGTFAGPCGTWIGCYGKCACGDTACRGACGLPSGECTTCLQTVTTCTNSSGCTAPVCSPSGADAGSPPAGGTCADLQTCCNAITNAQVKAGCNANATSGASAGGQYCGSVLMGLRAAKQCP
jgi:hypothetical protein